MPTVTLTAKSALSLPAREGGVRVDYWDQKVRRAVADAEDHELSRVQRGQTDWTDQASVVEIVLAHR